MLTDQPFSLLIKPASADCNQNCTYCFYAGRTQSYPGLSHRMSFKTLEYLIAGYLKTRQPQYVFTWQGGEPTLMGIDFFRKAVEFQRQYASPDARVANGLQTNALLLDDAFAEFLARQGFLLGVSLDGPAHLHDRYRTLKNGGGSYRKVMKGIDCLIKNEVPFNILTLISQANVTKGKEVYHFLCDKGFFYHQYVECVEFDTRGRPLPFTITGEAWGKFLCDVFDEWIKADLYRVSVRLFDAILTRLVENQDTVCSMGPSCGHYLVVEYQGDVYPCDFFVQENLKIGNIYERSWQQILDSEVFDGFAKQKSRMNQACTVCEYQLFCNGGCLKNRFYGQNDSRQPSWLCSGWKMFYAHALPEFRSIAQMIREDRRAANIV